MSVRLLVVTSGFPRRSETFALNELAELERRGALAGIVATKPGESGPAQPGADALAAHVTLLEPADAAAQARQVAARAVELGATAVHGYFAHAPADVARRAAAIAGLPFGFSAHARDARKVAPAELAARARAASCVVACNPDVAAVLADAGAGGVAVLPHGADLERFSPLPLRPPDGRVRLLAVGRLVEKKGFDVLLGACAQLPAQFTLRIVGEGPLRADLERRLVELDLIGRVVLAGSLTHRELPAEYACCDAVVAPSIEDASGDRDGLPNVVIEALACARPLVASAVAAIPTAVRDGETGLLVPPGDPDALAGAIVRLAGSPALACRLAHAGRQLVERRLELGACVARLHRHLEASYAG